MTDPIDFPVLPGFKWPGPSLCYSRPSIEEIVPKQQLEELLDIMRANPRDYISYQDCTTLSLNPDYSNDVTIRAIYGFPRDYLAHMVNWWSKDMKSYPATGIEYVRRPNLFLFDLEGMLVDTETYRNAASDIRKANKLWGRGHSPVSVTRSADTQKAQGILSHWIRSADMHASSPPIQQVKLLLNAIENVVDEMLPVTEFEDSGYKVHKEKPELWRTILASLGYVAVIDRHAILTGDIGQQIAVIEPRAIKNIIMVANPVSEISTPALRF